MSNTQIALDTTGTKLNFDSNTLVIDENSNRVGIGTDSPNAKLEISGGLFNCNNTSTKSLVYNPYAQTITSAGATLNFTGTDFRFLNDVLVVKNNTQRVGIGVQNPQELLHLKGAGDVKIKLEADTDDQNEDDNPEILFSQDNSGVNASIGLDPTNNLVLKNQWDHVDADLILGAKNTEYVRIKGTGNVGIGEDSPKELLHISGTSDPTLVIQNPIGNQTESGKISFREGQFDDEQINLRYDGDENKFKIDTKEKSNAFVIKRTTGNVGIGTSEPASKLEVEGIISSFGSASINIVDNSGNTITSNNNTEGSITVTHNHHTISHGAGDGLANVNLININGGVDGAILVLRQTSNDKDVHIRDNAGSFSGNLRLAGDFQMTTGNDTITLMYSGGNWFEISRSDNA